MLNNSFAYCSNNPVKRIDGNGHAWYDGIVNVWNKVTSFVQECFQAQAQANIISAEQKVYAANKTINGAKNLLKKATRAVSNWWENTAEPWLNQAKEKAKTLWNNTKEYVKDALHAQQQADILSAQMTYNAACKIGDWVSEHWRSIVDTIGYSYGIVSVVVAVAEKLIKSFTVSTPVFWIMVGVDVALIFYETGERAGWW